MRSEAAPEATAARTGKLHEQGFGRSVKSPGKPFGTVYRLADGAYRVVRR